MVCSARDGSAIAHNPSVADCISDIEGRMVLLELLSTTDAVDARRRRRHIRSSGTPDRHEQVPAIVAAYVQMRLSDLQEREMLRHARDA